MFKSIEFNVFVERFFFYKTQIYNNNSLIDNSYFYIIKFNYFLNMFEKLMSKKKPFFPINDELNKYLTEYNRNLKIPIFYEDLKRFSGSVSVYDKKDKDTHQKRLQMDHQHHPQR